MSEENANGPEDAGTPEAAVRRAGAGRLLAAAAMPVAAAALIIVGLALAYRVGEEDQNFGFVTYAPLDITDSLLILTTGMQIGWLSVVLGLVLGAAWGGYRVGLRRRPARSH